MLAEVFERGFSELLAAWRAWDDGRRRRLDLAELAERRRRLDEARTAVGELRVALYPDEPGWAAMVALCPATAAPVHIRRRAGEPNGTCACGEPVSLSPPGSPA